MDDLKPILDEYPLEYCQMLEDVYGRGLMSEGGIEAIDDFFTGINLKNKKVLDLGSGLGGLAFYVSEKYDCSVLGLEINHSMVEEAIKRIPSGLDDKVSFQVYSDFSRIPLEDGSFDVICSKGVLVHVNDKLTLFKELNRLLKKEGTLIINDWLCSDKGAWGENLQRMCQLEGLTLYPFTKESYSNILKDTGFSLKKSVDKSEAYANYNLNLVSYLRKNKEKFVDKYNEKSWSENIEGYELISKSQSDKELLVIEFLAKKNA